MVKHTSRGLIYFIEQLPIKLQGKARKAVKTRSMHSDPKKGKNSFFQGIRDYVKGLKKL